MTTMIIEENCSQAKQFIKYARTLPFVKVEENKAEAKSKWDEITLERIPGLAYTKEVRIARARNAMERYRCGERGITQEEMKKETALW